MCRRNLEIPGGLEMKMYLRVLEAVESSGVRAWLVGDPVREIVMGICPSNLNVVVEPCDLRVLKDSFGEGTILGGDAFPVLHTSILGSKVEIACMKGRSIEEDLAQRDFSMNAIAIRSDDGFVDPFNGRHDIRNGLVRLTGDDIDLVTSDPIRIVRMLRFAAELDMSIFWKSAADVRSFIAQNPDQIRNTPPERWGREILNGMRRRPYDFIYLCDRYDLFPLFLNDLEQLKEICIEGGGTLFDHTLNTLEIAQNFLGGRKRRDNDMAFSLSMLFHHAGSMNSQPADSVKAAQIAAQYLKSWGVNSETIETVAFVIERYRQLYEAKEDEALCASALKYGFVAMEMIVDFAICNSQADGMKNMETLANNKWRLSEIIRRFDETKRRTEGNLRYLTGNEVMQVLNIKPGKVVGEILNELDMAVGTGIIASKNEATEWVLKRGADSGVRK
jgi:tRNA nucleotidyltransferase/poly(A) polymerase